MPKRSSFFMIRGGLLWTCFFFASSGGWFGTASAAHTDDGNHTHVRPSILRSVWDYDQWHARNDTAMERRGTINVHHPPDNGRPMGICHLATILPLSTLQTADEETTEAAVARRIPFTLGTLEGVAAILLALQHLNTGNGTIIPEVEGLSEWCPLRFTTEVLDTVLDERIAVDQVIQLVERNPSSARGGSLGGIEDNGDAQTRPLPCAFLGSYRSAVSMPTSMITSIKGYPQFAALSTSAKLDDPDQFPLFGRFNPSDDGTAIAAILYLKQLGVTHLAVLHTNDAYGNSYVDGLIQATAVYAPDMVISSVDIPFNLAATPDAVRRIVFTLKATGFRYFFGVIFDSVHFDPVMEEAVRQGIAGTEDYTWIFSDGVSVNRIVHRRYRQDSPLHLASRGTGMITAVGGIPETNHVAFDKLAHALQSLNNEQDMAYIKSKLPQYDGEEDVDLIGMLSDYLAQPGLIAPFMYDTVIALGIAACHMATSNRNQVYLDGAQHFARTLETAFDGTSGQIVMNPITGTREATSAMFVMTNFVEESVEEGIVTLKAVTTDVFTGGKWTSLEPYLFQDGSPDPPPALPPLQTDAHHIAIAARLLISFMGLSSICLSVVFALWTKRNRHERVVKASQPIFLYIICVGTVLMGASILTLVVDDQIFEAKGCQFACLAFPWFLSLGFVIAASGLFTKTHRVNVILQQKQFRRIKVSALDVMTPMFVLVGVNALALALWTGISPAEWVREPTGFDAFERPSESMGYCSYDDSLPYILMLSITNIGALLYTCYEAYLARDASTDFAESEFIFKSMASVLLIGFLGIPIAILTRDNATAYNCVLAGIAYSVSLSFQLYIFVPKIKYHRAAVKEAKESPRRHRGGVFGGIKKFKNDDDGGAPPAGGAIEASAMSEGDFGVKVYNRRQIQEDLEAENKRLQHINQRLRLRIATLEAGKEGGRSTADSCSGRFDTTPVVNFDSSSFHDRQSRPDSVAVSEAESKITIDPFEHQDESQMEIAPF